MNLIQLRHFIALAETGSFSQAATQLQITQPALSRSIQALEAEIGLPLVDRIGRKNVLTPYGNVVLASARRVQAEVVELTEASRRLKGGEAGSVRVGLGPGPGTLLMTPFMAHMATDFPKVKVTISRGATHLQLQSLRSGMLDALVVDLRTLVVAPDLDVERLPDLQAGFLCRRRHPLRRRRRVYFDDLLQYPIAAAPLSDEVARILVAHFGPAAHPDSMVTLRCEDLSSLIDVAVQTDAVFLGILAAGRHAVARGDLAELPVHPLLDSAAQFALVTLRDRTEPPALELLRAFIARAMG
ncbi:LysR family transcriptional regulator [Cupriavidus nantongensis]|uniref:LysR family transcriptional regulator n=1 Tax=Cupriavidus nantongensis TaxID=1796606 RepID=UPI00358EB200